MKRSIEITFLQSALTLENPLMPTKRLLEWLEEKKSAGKTSIEKISFSAMENWCFDAQTTNLVHESGKFFSIEGIEIKTNTGNVRHWSQPIIYQPEIGFLGIISKRFDGILYFLLQAKIEPGNINTVQLSPTLQATKSNYTAVHKGKQPLYLDYFYGENKKPGKVLLDQLQSEQGARFLKKRNRNIIIEVEEDIEVHDDFCWLTLGQIKWLLTKDNLVNMDTRTVISGVPFGDDPLDIIDLYSMLKPEQTTVPTRIAIGLLFSAMTNKRNLHNIETIISWITHLKSKYELEVRQIPLAAVKEWSADEYTIRHKDEKYFKVIAVQSTIYNREVSTWSQPMIEAVQVGIIAFVIKKINGAYHFLVQAKLEAGNLDIVELAPTVQCITGNYREAGNNIGPPFLQYVLNAKPEQRIYDTHQSEEGGRFFREQNRNIIIEAGEEFPVALPENYIWMTLNQLQTFIKFNNYLNLQARSLISMIRFV